MPVVNSKEKKLTTAEIITNAIVDAKQNGDLDEAVPLQAAILAVAKEGMLPKTKVEQIGNTVFISHYSDDGKEVAMRAMNSDTARNYFESAVQYITALSKSGVERMTSDFTDKRIFQLFQSIAKRPEFAEWGMQVRKNSDGLMRAYVVMKG
jgi:hypothetical protein